MAFESNWTLLQILQSIPQIDNEYIKKLYGLYPKQESETTISFAVPEKDGGLTYGEVNATSIAYGGQERLKELIELAEQNSTACYARPACRFLVGKAHYVSGNGAQAVEYWRDQDIWEHLVGTRTAPIPSSETELAELTRYYEVLLQIFPDKPNAYFMLGAIHRSVGLWDPAVMYFEQAVALENSPWYVSTLGAALVQSAQNTERGLRLLELALAEQPDDIWIYESAARSYALAGECRRAREIYLQAEEVFPQRTEAVQWLAEFERGEIDGCKP